MKILNDTTLDDVNDLKDHQVLFKQISRLSDFDNNDNFTPKEKQLIKFSFEFICTKIDGIKVSQFSGL
jgi:hypothetical protein